MNAQKEPWLTIAFVRPFLSQLVLGEPLLLAEGLDVVGLAAWVREKQLGVLTQGLYQKTASQLADLLQADKFSALAESSMHGDSIKAIMGGFQRAEVPVVLLKGAALALTIYPKQSWRTMSDVDLWVQGEAMGAAVGVMQGVGFQACESEERPLAWQKLAKGEIQFMRTDWGRGLVELHWSPFSGWWLQQVAAIDEAEVWGRLERVAGEENLYHLGAEDMILQTALHLVLGTELRETVLRSLMDIAFINQQRAVDWGQVGERAKRWRVATAVWMVLIWLDDLIVIDEAQIARNICEPSGWQRWLLGWLMPSAHFLGEGGFTHPVWRHLFLGVIIDRWRDRWRMLWRLLWPERIWLQAQHGADISRWAYWRQRGERLWRRIRRV